MRGDDIRSYTLVPTPIGPSHMLGDNTTDLCRALAIWGAIPRDDHNMAPMISPTWVGTTSC